MKKVILKIGGMSCSACSSSLEKYLNKQKGIVSASVNLVLAQACIEYEENITIKVIEEYVKKSGFVSLGVYKNEEENDKNTKDIIFLILFSVLSMVMIYLSMGHMINMPSLSIIDIHQNSKYYALSLFVLTIPFLIYGIDIFIKGIKSLFDKSPNMDTLVTIGVWSSFVYSLIEMILIFNNVDIKHNVKNLYFESSAIVIFFIKLGRYIDSRSKEKAKEAIKELVQITPSSALILENGKEVEISIDEVKVGDILLVKPGMKVAVDGVVVKGKSHVNESFINGESTPSNKNVGDSVLAGSINLDGYLEYEAKRVGKDSTISEIVRLVVEAGNTKAPIARIADRVSGFFVPSIICIAILTLIGYLMFGYEFSEAIKHFVTVLVVACPCALGLATPIAIVVSEGNCALNGILVKNSEVLENTSKVDTIIFDKTGTLTYGKLKVSKVFNYSDYNDDELLSLIALIESKSSHPISSSFKEFLLNAEEKNVEFESIDGVGIYGRYQKREIYLGNNKLFDLLKINNLYKNDEEKLTNEGCSIVYVIENNIVLGLIGVKDVVREESKATIETLNSMNKNVIMLTGDNQNTASMIAKSIGIDNVVASMLPKDKKEYINKLKSEGKLVMMVGDGINDAPSLVNADIGVSVNSGSDIALDSADVILIRDNLNQLITLFKVSQKTIRIIKENLFWAFFYNLIMIPIAIGLFSFMGLSMNPMWGSLAMILSSLTVVLNSLRLRKI